MRIIGKRNTQMDTNNYKIFFVGTPIGNLEDITFRSLRIMLESDLIFAEDTRNYTHLKGLILEKYSDTIKSLNISISDQKILSYREQNHEKAWIDILGGISEQKQIAFVSDAGMPGISDPGYLLVQKFRELDISYDIIPTTTAIAPALILSGLPMDSFSFLGFMPRKGGKIVSLLEKYKDLETTVVFYESPKRIKKSTTIIKEAFPDAKIISIAEITKKFQKSYTFEELQGLGEVRGEWVVCVALH